MEQPDQNELKRILKALAEMESSLRRAGGVIDSTVEPVRSTVLKRYPFLFALLVTLGVAASILGLERLLLQFSLFDEQPLILFLGGLGILAITGRLYKKLG